VLVALDDPLELITIGLVLFHLLEFIGIRSADEVALHVVNVAVGVHEVLLVFSFDLNAAHHYVVLDVNAFFFFFVSLTVLLRLNILVELLLLL
jgi:hypothetical protein